jgi:hypothetical protein
MCRNELNFYTLCGDILINFISCLGQEEEYLWNPDIIIVVNTLCHICTENPERQRRSLEQLECRRQRIFHEIAFEQERKVEIDEFRRLLQDEQEISTNVITYINPMINPPNPSHPTRAEAIRLLYAYTILFTDYLDRTGLRSMVQNIVNDMLHRSHKPEFPGLIIKEKLLKESMKARIDLNVIYFQQQEQDDYQLVPILAMLTRTVLTPIAINSLAPAKVDCIICNMPLGQVDFLGTIELAYQTSCNHIFGGRCITTWLKNNTTCPICRSQLAVPGELAVTEEEEEEVELEFLSEVFGHFV